MEGRCYFCNKEVTNKTAKRHAKTCKKFKGNNDENVKATNNTKERYIIKLNDKYTKEYVLYIAIDTYLRLQELDQFIRDIWVECCGHLSAFNIKNNNFYNRAEDYYENNQNYKLEEVFQVGDKFKYEYDFGYTTYLEGEIVDKIISSENEAQLEIIIRNNKIGKLNSPREGECVYEGNIKAENEYIPYNKTKLITKKEVEKEIKRREKEFREVRAEMNLDNPLRNGVGTPFKEDMSGIITQEMINNLIKGVERDFKKSMDREVEGELKELIESLTKDEIKRKLDLMEINYKSSEKKSVLVNTYMKYYKTAYIELFEIIDKSIYDDLIYMKNHKYRIKTENIEKLNVPEVLNELGIVVVGRNENFESYLFVPKEISEIIDKVKFDINKINRNQEIVDILEKISVVYGCIKIEDFIELLNHYKIVNITLEDIDDAYEIIKVIKLKLINIFDMSYYNGIIMDEALDIDDVMDIIENDSKYKIFPKNKLKKIEGIKDIAGSKELYELRDFLENFEIDDEEAEEAIAEICYEYQLLERKEDIVYFIDQRYSMPENIKVLFLDVTYRLLETIPNWRLKGYSENEVNTKYGINRTFTENTKVGRNELCPCGSGKKFKKCCGKNVIEVDFTQKR